jgi:hypothetical protein
MKTNYVKGIIGFKSALQFLLCCLFPIAMIFDMDGMMIFINESIENGEFQILVFGGIINLLLLYLIADSNRSFSFEFDKLVIKDFFGIFSKRIKYDAIQIVALGEPDLLGIGSVRIVVNYTIAGKVLNEKYVLHNMGRKEIKMIKLNLDDKKIQYKSL